MFVHDGLVHKRFPVGPIANVPYFRKVAAAHQVNFNGVMMLCLAGPLPLATDSVKTIHLAKRWMEIKFLPFPTT